MADVEFVDREFGHIRVPAFRKIKFKQLSFTNISDHFNKFRLDRLKSKLISNKEKLVSMEFKGSQLVPGNSREKVEKKVLNKTAAIARLESKINFLESGNYLTEEFVNSRAIKLKNVMMRNLEYNRENLYGLNEATKEAIINDEVEANINSTENQQASSTTSTDKKPKDPIDAQMLEQQEQIAAAVQKIMAEDQQKKQQAESVVENVTPVVENIPVEVSQNLVEEETIVTPEEYQTSVADQMKKIEVTKPINAEELAEAINKEMQKIKVSSNNSTSAKVNKFINDDGTYRLKREDIDEDFRITRFDRNQLPKDRTTTEEKVQEPEIAPFDKSVRRTVPNVGTPRKAVTEMPQTRQYIIQPIASPTIKESFFENAVKDNNAETVESAPSVAKSEVIKPSREVALVVPERHTISEQKMVESNHEGIKNIELADNLQAVLAKATVLTNDLKRIEESYAEEAAALQQTEQRYDATVDQFIGYVSGLEDKCNATYQELEVLRQGKQSKEDQINVMINLMAQGFDTSNTPRVRSK